MASRRSINPLFPRLHLFKYTNGWFPFLSACIYCKSCIKHSILRQKKQIYIFPVHIQLRIDWWDHLQRFSKSPQLNDLLNRYLLWQLLSYCSSKFDFDIVFVCTHWLVRVGWGFVSWKQMFRHGVGSESSFLYTHTQKNRSSHSELFCKKGVLGNSAKKVFLKVHRKTLVLESLL